MYEDIGGRTRFKVSCNCGDNYFVTLAQARQHADYEMCAGYPHGSVFFRWQYTIYIRQRGRWVPYERVRRVRESVRL